MLGEMCRWVGRPLPESTSQWLEISVAFGTETSQEFHHRADDENGIDDDGGGGGNKVSHIEL